MNVFSKGLVLGVIVLFVGNGIFASVMSKETPIFTILNTGDIIIVDDEGDGDFTFIQNAIDNATCGDIITVYSGMYNETVVIDKQLVLEGIDEEYENGGDTGNPVIDAQNAGTVVEIQANGVRITGFTIQDSKNGSAGIFIARCNEESRQEDSYCHAEGVWEVDADNIDIGPLLHMLWP